MSTAETVTLWIHVVAGFVALGGGLGAFVTKKGGQRHRRFGRSYVYAMAVVSGTAIVLFGFAQTFARQFLTLVAIFSFYFAFSGYRVLSRKRPTDDPETVDWVAVGLLGVASIGLVVIGVRSLGGSDFSTVLLVFGGIGTVFTLSDIRDFRRASGPHAWIGEHVTRMGAGYIATVTAFSAVNFDFLPLVARWLWPTILGTPLIFYLGRTYEAKLTGQSG